MRENKFDAHRGPKCYPRLTGILDASLFLSDFVPQVDSFAIVDESNDALAVQHPSSLKHVLFRRACSNLLNCMKQT
jgi:hypothetical protein